MTELTEDTATEAVRTVKLLTGPNGVTYYLGPKWGNMRGIICQRTDGVRTKCPDRLEGGFVDVRSATAAVEAYLASKGKARPEAGQAPVMDFREPDAAELGLPVPAAVYDELPVEPGEGVPATVNAGTGAADPDGETITQRALRERLSGQAVTTEPDAQLEEAAPAQKRRGPRAKQ